MTLRVHGFAYTFLNTECVLLRNYFWKKPPTFFFLVVEFFLCSFLFGLLSVRSAKFTRYLFVYDPHWMQNALFHQLCRAMLNAIRATVYFGLFFSIHFLQTSSSNVNQTCTSSFFVVVVFNRHTITKFQKLSPKSKRKKSCTKGFTSKYWLQFPLASHQATSPRESDRFFFSVPASWLDRCTR